MRRPWRRRRVRPLGVYLRAAPCGSLMGAGCLRGHPAAGLHRKWLCPLVPHGRPGMRILGMPVRRSVRPSGRCPADAPIDGTAADLRRQD
ncbi:hypothetical protein ACP26L_31435 [Paenibacillus sp. S-38]|uniref:hypothetical protein n=1 Tax=Paenibacillus sp. S-38 TaxID=3416710 RepID=UPI003CF0D6D8